MAVLRAGAFADALHGIAYAWRSQPNLRLQGFLALAALAVVAWLRVGLVWTAIVLLCIALVLSLEILNTALEALVDLVSPQPHPLAKAAKDAAAGAVLVAGAGALLVGVVTVAAAFVRH